MPCLAISRHKWGNSYNKWQNPNVEKKFCIRKVLTSVKQLMPFRFFSETWLDLTRSCYHSRATQLINESSMDLCGWNFFGRVSRLTKVDTFGCKTVFQQADIAVHCSFWFYYVPDLFVCFILLITSREVCQEFQPSYDIFCRSGAKGCSDHRFCVPLAYTAQLLSLNQHRANNQYPDHFFRKIAKKCLPEDSQ